MGACEYRSSRRARVRDRNMQIRPRDIAILEALTRMRAVRTTDIKRLFFKSKSTAAKRLRRLFDSGLTRPLVIDLAQETRHSITRVGHDVLADAMEDDVPQFHGAPRFNGRQVAHHDLLVATWASIVLGATRHGASLTMFRPEWELRSENPHAVLVPDALFVLEKDTATIRIALEVDTGTERRRVLAHKIERYNALDASRDPLFGIQPDAVLLVTLKERRARRLAQQLGSRAGIPLILSTGLFMAQDGGLSTGLATPSVLANPEFSFSSGFLTGIEV